MKLIVGLGNPGKNYQTTRHNVGFLVLDNILGDIKWQNKFNGQYYKTVVENVDVIYLKPQTFMNLSGDSIRKYIKYFNIDINDILIIQDDLDMNLGTYKLKKDSSSGGHNGIKSIESNIKTKNFARLKIGILDNTKDNVIDFVLSKFSKRDLDTILNIDYEKIINTFIREGYEYTLNMYKN